MAETLLGGRLKASKAGKVGNYFPMGSVLLKMAKIMLFAQLFTIQSNIRLRWNAQVDSVEVGAWSRLKRHQSAGANTPI